MCGSIRTYQAPDAPKAEEVIEESIANTVTVEPQPPRNVALTVVDSGISLFIDSKSYLISREHRHYGRIVDAIRAKDYLAALTFIDEKHALEAFSPTDPDFEVRDGLVYLHGKPFTSEVSDKVVRMVQEGMSSEPLQNFLRKLRDNPASSAQRELLLFMVANQFMIHEDGDIILYKRVQEDYRSHHANVDGSYFVNTVGAIIEMPPGRRGRRPQRDL